MVLDAADRERERDLQRADLRVDLIRARELDAVELAQDLVALVHVPLVELVVCLDRRARDAVELVELRLQLPGRDLLELERERRQSSPLSTCRGARSISSGSESRKEHRWPSRSHRCPTATTRSSHISTSRRCASTMTSTTRRTSTTRTRRSRGRNGQTVRPRRSSETSS